VHAVTRAIGLPRLVTTTGSPDRSTLRSTAMHLALNSETGIVFMRHA